jgi:hypothetical protein
MHSHHHHHRTAVAAGFMVLLALVVLLMLALPSRAAAAPRHDRGLTITSTPDPISAGQGVLIYGHLAGPDNAFKRIWLFHRINPAARFTPISVTRTNGSGFYEFIRADGVVVSNRNWFVLGPGNSHSRTIHEWVSAAVTLAASSATASTADPVTFSGTAYPPHDHQLVLLQKQDSTSGNGWHTIASGYTDGDSSYTITHRFRSAGSYTLRTFLPATPRNIASPSPSVDLTVQQQQNPSFTINASAAVLTNGQSETISGTLYSPGSTTTGQPDVTVTLYGAQAAGGFRALQSTSTDATGAYSFTQMPLHNTVYQVRSLSKPVARTANLFVGVQDVVTASVASSTVAVGDPIKITGSVTPDHSGHALYLQQQDSSGRWVDVQTGYLTPASTFSFSYTPGQAGELNLRVQITGGPWNIGGVSTTLPVTVSGTAPVSSLPPAK